MGSSADRYAEEINGNGPAPGITQHLNIESKLAHLSRLQKVETVKPEAGSSVEYGVQSTRAPSHGKELDKVTRVNDGEGDDWGEKTALVANQQA